MANRKNRMVFSKRKVTVEEAGSPDVLMIREFTNMGVVLTPEGVVVIDSGFVFFRDYTG